MLRWLFVVTVVVLALSLSTTTAIASDSQATVISFDNSEDLNPNQLDFDDVVLDVSTKNAIALSFYQPNQLLQPAIQSRIAIKLIRAPPTTC
ncbi:hypothetical protein [Pseudoalteromonas spongiae]|uniref:hypothetical protein n=1 Tax=Pseudoalteromonas spongiae TaxID=298657 RepID=UPI00110B9013|nr:hypothetical protein [Pseudoalteromonas spongiae]TMO82768.1 hypothetical protein CWC15_17925 [Pseudoalteromonas spongiae]